MKISLIILICLIGASYQNNAHPKNAPNLAVKNGNINGRNSALNAQNLTGSNEVRNGRNLAVTIANVFLATSTTRTYTSYTTTSTTITTATITTCIPSTYFRSSTACRRRRAIYEDSGLPDEFIEQQKRERETPKIEVAPIVERKVAEPEIMSSFHQDEEQTEHSIKKRYVTTIISSTTISTVTAFSFTSTTYTKTLWIGSTTSVLLCLPAGVAKC